jgi:DNA-binding NarL/FixJ family response regulator
VFVSGESSYSSDPEPIVQSKADVVLMDGGTTGATNLQFVLALCQSYPSVQVVLIGMNENESIFLDAVRAGVTGFLLKDASAKDVIAAIRCVSQGEAVCPPRLCRALFRRIAQGESCVPSSTATKDSRLTRRQLELVPMIAKGLTNKEIASHLNLSEQTVKNHIHRMLQKVGAEDRLQVAEKAISSASRVF